MQDVIKHVSTHVDPYSMPPDSDTASIITRVIREVRPYTMVPDPGLACTIRLTLDAIRSNVPGDLVECGTWLGGASFAMLLAQRYAFGEIKRPVHMYDSFQGMSPPSEQDGEHARWWHHRSLTVPEDPDHQNYCRAPLEMVQEAIVRLNLDNHVVIRPGWFQDTLLQARPSKIAVLRVDCDWYDPCKLVYKMLAPLVSPKGPIIIDDYYAWEGCVLATHEYLAEHKLPWQIKSAPNFCGAWMIKTEATW